MDTIHLHQFTLLQIVPPWSSRRVLVGDKLVSTFRSQIHIDHQIQFAIVVG